MSTNAPHHRRLAVVLALSLCAGPLFCQTAFISIPDSAAGQYHFDFARNFFTSPQAEKADRAAYEKVLSKLESFKGKVTLSASNLLQALMLTDEVTVEFYRHNTYLYLRWAVDTKDRTSLDESSDLEAACAARTAFMQQELMQIGEDTIDAFITQKPALARYRFAVQSARRYRPHTLALAQEEMLTGLAPFTSEWQYDLYGQLLSRTKFGTVATDAGNLDVRSQRAAIAANPDRKVRRAGFTQLYEGYAAQRDLYAFSLLNLEKARNRTAQLHHFDDAASEAYYSSYWTKAEVKDLLERVAQHVGVYKRYQKLRAEKVKKETGNGDVAVWDMSAPGLGHPVPRFTIDQARTVVREALAPLGPEFGKELSLLLDPSNGRMDIVPGGNRKSGGFSKGFPGVTTVFFGNRFDGYYNDMRILAHEATHAIHRQLMKNSAVLPCYADGPHYLFESFAMFNELLLPMYLWRNDPDPARKRYFLEQLFEGKGMAPFAVGKEAMLEQAIDDGAGDGTVTSADDLDTLTRRTTARFSLWGDRHPELSMDWMKAELFYEDPFYDINYVWGSLLALKYYQLYTESPEHFMQGYAALMKNGFTDTPEVLLKHFLGIDLHDERVLTDVVTLLERWVGMLEKEYAR